MYHEGLQVFLAFFLFIAFGVLLKGISSILRHGLHCGNAFTLMWVFAYAGPTAVYLVSPETIAAIEGYAWMDTKRWNVAALLALGGLLSFGLGYISKRNFQTNHNAGSYLRKRATRAQITLLIVSLALQLYLLFLIFSQEITINFAHRAIHWRYIGLAIRLAFFSLPAAAISFNLFLDKKSLIRLLLLLITLAIASPAAFSLGARMFVVLLPMVLILIFTNRNPKTRILSFFALFAMAVALSVGLYLFLRTDVPDLRYAFYKVMLGDIGRMHTLAYTSKHIGLMRSDLINPPILASYFYWLILPIPRSFWPGKPFAANLQFSFWFRAEHTSFYVPYALADMQGRTEFGFIDEALLNLGLSGMLIMIIWGYLAAWLNQYIKNTRYLRVAVPIGFLLGTIYTFNGILLYLLPFLVIGFFLDKIAHRTSRTPHPLPSNNLQRAIR